MGLEDVLSYNCCVNAKAFMREEGGREPTLHTDNEEHWAFGKTFRITAYNPTTSSSATTFIESYKALRE
eukprot:7435149-Prorocentrum_lima.AAC.1